MVRDLIFVLGCLLCTLSLTISDEVPTIAISCGNTPLATLSKFQQSMDTVVFKKLLASLWNEDTKVVMAMEDELSLEDFSMKDTDGQRLLQLFENTAERRFFPSVNQPDRAIELLSKNGFSVKDYNDNTYVNGSEKVIALIDFNENDQNNNDDRQSTLKKHNNDISKIFNSLCEQHNNVILIFSGKLNPWIHKTESSNVHHLVTRHLMAVENKQEPLIIKDNKKKSLIYSASYPTLKVDNQPAVQLKPSVSPDVFLDSSRNDLLKVGKGFLLNDTMITLRFRFKATKSYWTLEKIEYENLNSNTQLSPRMSISAPMGMSYLSKGPVVFSNDLIVLTFDNKFQVQPWLPSNVGSVKFSTPEEQNAFFSAPILAGLFVTFIFLFIVTWGIIMIMDIKTMDRFDDPKGKTISINVVE